MQRAEESVAYLILLGAAVLGVANCAWWSVAAPTLLLAALRYPQHEKFALAFRASARARILALAMGGTLLNSVVAAAAAFALGRAMAWFVA